MPDTPNADDRIDAARHAIVAQIAERNRLHPEQAPMPPWDACVRAMSYVQRMPVDDLRSIRLHCDLFLGENTARQFFASGIDVPGYAWCGEGIDPALWASEPIIPCLGKPIGSPFADKHVNLTTTLIQRYLCNLIRLGVRDGQHVVEIGAGYGGLAESLLRARDLRYTIIDLPETLIFSAAFLLHHFPDKKAYVYRPGDDPSAMEGAELVFLPNYRADWIKPCDIAINTVSFPEMDRAALRGYLSLLRERLLPNGFLMSVNYEFNPARMDNLYVSDILGEYFEFNPVPEASLELRRDVNFRPTLVCTRKGETRPRATLREIIIHERSEITV